MLGRINLVGGMLMFFCMIPPLAVIPALLFAFYAARSALSSAISGCMHQAD